MCYYVTTVVSGLGEGAWNDALRHAGLKTRFDHYVNHHLAAQLSSDEQLYTRRNAYLGGQQRTQIGGDPGYHSKRSAPKAAGGMA